MAAAKDTDKGTDKAAAEDAGDPVDHKARADAAEARADTAEKALLKARADADKAAATNGALDDGHGGTGYMPLPDVPLDHDPYTVLAAAFCWTLPSYNEQHLPDWHQQRAFEGAVVTGLPVSAVQRGLEALALLPAGERGTKILAARALAAGLATQGQFDAMTVAELSAYSTQHPEDAARVGALSYTGAKGDVVAALTADPDGGPDVGSGQPVAAGQPDYQ